MNLLQLDHNNQTSACKLQDVPEQHPPVMSDVSLEFLDNPSTIYYLLSISSCLCIIFIITIAVVPERG